MKFNLLHHFILPVGAIVLLYFIGSSLPSSLNQNKRLVVEDSLFAEFNRVNPLLATAEYKSGQVELIASHDLFQKEKSPHTLRIVIQGEGAAAGFPYYYNGTFSKMLEQWLQYAYPGKKIEVINTALVTNDLEKHLERVQEVIDLKPDLVIFYGGHHELNAAYQRLKLEKVSTSSSAKAWLNIRSFFKEEAKPDILERFQAFETLSSFESHLPELEKQLVKEAETLFSIYRAHQVPVLALEPVANLSDFPPLQSRVGMLTAAQQAALKQLNDLVKTASWQEAFEIVKDLEAHAMDHAEYNFLAARVYAHLGRKRLAMRYYDYARQHDDYVLRGHDIISEAYKSAANKYGYPWLNLPSLLRKASGEAFIGNNLMINQSHFNQKGHFFTAQVLAEYIMHKEWFGPASHLASADRMKALIPVFPVDDHYGDLIMEQLTLQWPYYLNGYRVYGDPSKHNGQGFRLAQERFNQRITHKDMHLQWMQQRSTEGQMQEAVMASRMLIRQYPNCERVFFEVAAMELGFDRKADANAHFQRAFELSKGNSTLLAIVNILMEKGDRELAAAFAAKARKRATGSNQLAKLRSQLEKSDKTPG